jgi:nucleoside-diphosphate-sugar epimerase
MLNLAQTVSKVFGRGLVSIRMCPEKADYCPSVAVDIGTAKRKFGYKPQYGLEAGLTKLKGEMEAMGR